MGRDLARFGNSFRCTTQQDRINKGHHLAFYVHPNQPDGQVTGVITHRFDIWGRMVATLRKARDHMATMTPAVAKPQQSKLSKYRAMGSSVDRSSYGDSKALKEEGRKIDESLRPERSLANGLLLKR